MDVERERLITEHLPRAQRQISHFVKSHNVPPWVPMDELQAAGAVGLVQAARDYRPDYDVLFWTYASKRVLGAVLDDLRRMDWVPRQVRERRQRTGELLQHTVGIAAAEWTAAKDDPAQETADADEIARMMAAVARLPSRTRYVIEQYFWIGRVSREIGVDLGVTEARICQIRKEAITALRESFAAVV